jgi:hypothetical protein
VEVAVAVLVQEVLVMGVEKEVVLVAAMVQELLEEEVVGAVVAVEQVMVPEEHMEVGMVVVKEPVEVMVVEVMVVMLVVAVAALVAAEAVVLEVQMGVDMEEVVGVERVVDMVAMPLKTSISLHHFLKRMHLLTLI